MQIDSITKYKFSKHPTSGARQGIEISSDRSVDGERPFVSIYMPGRSSTVLLTPDEAAIFAHDLKALADNLLEATRSAKEVYDDAEV